MGSGRQVAVMNLNPGEVRHEFFQSILSLVIADSQTESPLIAGVWSRIAGGNLGIHRNEAVDFFYNDQPYEWLLFFDSDIQFPPDTVAKLMEHADPESAPIVSGLYVNVSIDGNVIPMGYHYEPGSGNNFVPLTAEEIAANDTIVVDGVGAGCLLIHRSVIEKLIAAHGWPAPVFGNDIVLGVINGEDFTFCLRVRELGIPILLVNTVELTHIKSSGITKEHLLAAENKERINA